MNTHPHTDAWVRYILIVLGLIVAACAVGAITQAMRHEPVSEMLAVPGMVAAVGLVRLLVLKLLI